MEKKPKDQADFLKWYDQQIAEKAVFDFRKEMDKYCVTDVDILRQGMQEFRRLFMEMKDIHSDKSLGSDPLQYMIIASLCVQKTLSPTFNHQIPRQTKTYELLCCVHQMNGTPDVHATHFHTAFGEQRGVRSAPH